MTGICIYIWISAIFRALRVNNYPEFKAKKLVFHLEMAKQLEQLRSFLLHFLSQLKLPAHQTSQTSHGNDLTGKFPICESPQSNYSFQGKPNQTITVEAVEMPLQPVQVSWV